MRGHLGAKLLGSCFSLPVLAIEGNVATCAGLDTRARKRQHRYPCVCLCTSVRCCPQLTLSAGFLVPSRLQSIEEKAKKILTKKLGREPTEKEVSNRHAVT